MSDLLNLIGWARELLALVPPAHILLVAAGAILAVLRFFVTPESRIVFTLAAATLVALGCWLGGLSQGRAAGEARLKEEISRIERELRTAAEAEKARQQQANDLALDEARKAVAAALDENEDLQRKIQDLNDHARTMDRADDVCLDAGSVQQLRKIAPGRKAGAAPAH